MIKTVCRNYPWASPQYVDDMFYDAKDQHGLLYWYKDVEDQHKQITPPKK